MNYLYFFLDESGNSGSRFWDPQQPTYIEGGWIIEKKKIKSVNNIIKQIESSYPFKIKEIKGSKLIKQKPGPQLILNMIKAIGQNGGLPVLYVAEKKYLVCAKIVETFFDPLYNIKIPWSDQWNPEKRQQYAQIFYDIDSPLIEEFANAYRYRKPSDIKQNAEKWIIELREKNLKT